MKKILNLLEKNVQWIALGLGVLFFGYIVWSDLYNNPATKSVALRQGSVILTPANVDSEIADDIAHNLQPKLHAPHPDFRVDVNFPPPISLDTIPSTQPGTAVAWDSWGFDIANKVQAGSANPQTTLVQSLPTIPPLRYVDQETLRTVLSTPAGNQDADAVTTFWAFPAADVAKAYRAAFGGKIPDSAQTIYFVQVVLTRQEQLDDGSWGADVVVDRPVNFPAPPFPYPQPPGPDLQKHLDQYRIWMLANQQAIVEPDFPAVAFNRPDLEWQKLESWIPARAQQQFLDSQPIVDTPAVIAAPAAAAPAPRPVVTPPPASDNNGTSIAGEITSGSGIFDSAPRPPVNRGAPQPQPEIVNGVNNSSGPGLAPPPPPIPQLTPFPPGGLAVAAIAGPQDFMVWCHDLSVQPGKSYRYKVRYTLFNPVYNQPNKAKQEVADTFGIDSPDTGWSDTAAVPWRTRFFATGKIVSGHVNVTVPFTVFTWHNGLWQKKDYPAIAPGDEIGSDEAADGNFLTHFTFLDAKSDNREDSVSHSLLLAPDNGGPSQVRDFQADSMSQDFKRLKRQVDTQTPPTPSAPTQAEP